MEVGLFGRSSSRRRRSARIVVRSSNPVHSVLYRVVVFMNASRRRFLLQIEFRARILRVVYVGAIAVLFRFVVMMLNLSETGSSTRTQSKEESRRERGQVFGGMTRRLAGVRGRRYGRSSDPIIPEDVGTFGSHGKDGREVRRERVSEGEVLTPTGIYVEWVKRRDPRRGMSAFGQVLYSDGRRYVVAAGMVLLVSMIGSIVLTLKVRTFAMAKRQEIHQQRSRDADRGVRRVKNR